MEFGGKKRRKQAAVRAVSQGQYIAPLQFFRDPPEGTISLNEFEQYAVERLKVLKAVENFDIKWNTSDEKNLKEALRDSSKTIQELRNERLEQELRDLQRKEELELLHGILRRKGAGDSGEEERRARKMDHVSHFILRLAYCKSDELRRWFIQQEVDLFRCRFDMLRSEDKTEFLRQNSLHYAALDEREKAAVLEELTAATHATSASTYKAQATDFYKVPFVEALDLVKGRRVLVRGGHAFVPDAELSSLVVAAYRQHLSLHLALTARVLPHLEEDLRLLPLLQALSRRYLGQEFGQGKRGAGGLEHITAEMLDDLALQSFPLCMRNLYTALKEEHHLKHWARLQYALFLKGLGMPLEETLRYWRREFTRNPNIDGDKFEKQYAYNVRHSYGKEGKRANYTPYSCLKVIMSNQPGPGDKHGCPFKHTSPEALHKQLLQMHINPAKAGQIVDKAKEGGYQIACGLHFEAVHRTERAQTGVDHPNQYFLDSQRLLHPEHFPAAPASSQGTPAAASQGTPSTSQVRTPLAENTQARNPGTGTGTDGIQGTPSRKKAVDPQELMDSDPMSQEDMELAMAYMS